MAFKVNSTDIDVMTIVWSLIVLLHGSNKNNTSVWYLTMRNRVSVSSLLASLSGLILT